MSSLSTPGRSVVIALLAALGLPCFALATPPSEVVVAIDIGHTPVNPGAVSARGRVEYEFNRELAADVRAALLDAGFSKAFLIDPDGTLPSLEARADAASDRHATVLVSIHHDSVQPRYLAPWDFEGKSLQYCDRFHGYSIFVSRRNAAFKESLSIAKRLGTALRASGLAPTEHHAEAIPGENRPFLDRRRGVHAFDDLRILKRFPGAAVLVEAGVLVNRVEEQDLRSPSRRVTVAKAIAAALAGQYVR